LNGQVAFTFNSGNDFDIDPAGSNKAIGVYLDNFGAAGAYPLPDGALIGPDTGTNYTWLGHDPLLGALVLANATGSGTIGSPILFAGPFAGVESAFIGLQFQVNGQTYYGWVRVGAPVSINGGWIYDYAYETSPDTPINAGQTNEPIYFEATFNGGNEMPPNKSTHSGDGTFVLESSVDGYTLSYNLTLDGSFAPISAGIFGPANPCLNSPRLVADLGDAVISNLPPIGIVPFGPSVDVPLMADLNRPKPISQPPAVVVYDGQITLTGNQVAELLAGQLYVNFKSTKFRQGELRGEILPTAPVQFSATWIGRNEIPRNPRNTSMPRGEAAFTLTGSTLDYEVALATNFAWTAVGIYASPFANPFNLVAKLDTTIGVMIPPGGLPNAPGLPGQTLYDGQSALNLTDEQVYRLERGEFYINVLTSGCRNGEIGGRILQAE
jgi:hypothetical protein